MTRLGRNEPCHCGSGKKYKRCHLEQDEKKTSTAEKEHHLKIDPRIFIHAPYIVCPKCSRAEFGVLMIGNRSFVRRCKSCFFTNDYPLPPIKKLLIYLDQPVISNITKVLDPRSVGHARAIQNPYWLELYKHLDRLQKLQLILCPDSFYHREESLASPDFESMRRLYEHLSGGATFHARDTITQFQISVHFRNWLDGTPEAVRELEATDVVLGDLHKWQDRLNISVDLGVSEGEVEELRETRDRMYAEMKAIFERWRDEKGYTFKDRVLEEATSFGRATFQNYIQYLKRFREIHAGVRELGPEDVFPPSSQMLISSMLEEMRGREMTIEVQMQKLSEYFAAESILEIPFIRISSILYASIARKSAAGQIRPPSRGAFTDINAIASILPYVDAMFVDDENAAYLNERPASEMLGYQTKIFSNNTREEFLAYLEKIERDADPKQLELVREIYGECEPYLSILVDDRAKRESEPPKKLRPSIEQSLKEVKQRLQRGGDQTP